MLLKLSNFLVCLTVPGSRGSFHTTWKSDLFTHVTFLWNRQAALEELKRSARLVFPLVSDGDRELLRMLEEAGIEFVGTTFEAGQLASHKHRSVFLLVETRKHSADMLLQS